MLASLAKKYARAKIFVITPIWRKDTETESRWERFELVEQCIREAASHLPEATVIRGFDLVPHDEDFYADLRLHPNDGGFDRYFENLWPRIQAALKE
jgi:hypothetical protein